MLFIMGKIKETLGFKITGRYEYIFVYKETIMTCCGYHTDRVPVGHPDS
jgi:hypothetical protein